jgi:hypothetical protein
MSTPPTPAIYYAGELSVDASVVNRGVAYGGATAGYGEDEEDTTKSALVPGESPVTATVTNYTNYTRGLNRVIVDIANLPVSTLSNTSDFEFRVGNTQDPSTWTVLHGASLPTVLDVVDLGHGVWRVTLSWANEVAIKNNWLQVTVKATGNTGLAENDVFYLGNQIADVEGNPGAGERVQVNSFDSSDIRLNQSVLPDSVGIGNIYDVDRSGSVNSFDTSDARFNQVIVGGLLMITIPANTLPQAASAALASSGQPQSLSVASSKYDNPMFSAISPLVASAMEVATVTSVSATTPSTSAVSTDATSNHTVEVTANNRMLTFVGARSLSSPIEKTGNTEFRTSRDFSHRRNRMLRDLTSKIRELKSTLPPAFQLHATADDHPATRPSGKSPRDTTLDLLFSNWKELIPDLISIQNEI